MKARLSILMPKFHSSRTLGTEQLHFVSDLLSKFLYPLQDGSKFDLEGFRCAFGKSHSTIHAVILFGTDQKIDDLSVEPCYDCF